MMTLDKNEFKATYVEYLGKRFGKDVSEASAFELYNTLGKVTRDFAKENQQTSNNQVSKNSMKELHYFSMEFLIGRLLTSNLMNMGIYGVIEEGLSELGVDIHQLEKEESDAGLGNGGLGRLAACFLDSIASLGYPGHGNCLRYTYGFFKQSIENSKQVEYPDKWLENANYEWETVHPEDTQTIEFYGHVESYEENGVVKYRTVDTMKVQAVPFEVPVVGYDTTTTNALRLWKAVPSETFPLGEAFEKYEKEVRMISEFLYPDDSTEEGKMLRVKQQYFFSAAGVRRILSKHFKEHGTFENLDDKIVIQINDTHPTLVIPEMMRIFMDEHNMPWDQAWAITNRTVAYTNHTILAEALERWPIGYIETLLPRIYQIIKEIDTRYRAFVMDHYNDSEIVEKLAIIGGGTVRMAHLAVAGSFSVNGVAALHTDILKEQEMKEFNELYPSKFNNKTNGITHRRWLAYCNPELKTLLDQTIGERWINLPEGEFKKLIPYATDVAFRQQLISVKRKRKEILASYIKDTLGVEVDPNSIFDIQIKRLHAYKRQLLNVLHVMHLYNELKTNPNFDMAPRTFIFAAKSAPAYYFAKDVIELINRLMVKINNDSAVNKKLKVVFLPNYNVSLAEILFPAADISEQISTAGKEASGTGNMKFMMNGALTLGTMDGANVEIAELAGRENCFIFGMETPEVVALRESGTYSARSYYENDARIKKVLDQICNGETSFYGELPGDAFASIREEILDRNDEYFVLADFDAYVNAQSEVSAVFKDQSEWFRRVILNIANSGFFSSDRTIQEYVEDIWHLERIKF